MLDELIEMDSNTMENMRGLVTMLRELPDDIPDLDELSTDEEIMDSWETNRKVQAAQGTLLHFQCEMYLNGCVIEDQNPEFQQFLGLYHNVIEGRHEEVRTELSGCTTGQASEFCNRGPEQVCNG